MAVALISPTSSLPSSASSSSSLQPRSKGSFATGACASSSGRRARGLVSCSCTTASGNRGLERRHLLLSGLASSFAIALPVSESYADTELDDEVNMAMLVDETNAYSFLYPVQLPGKKLPFRWIESRKSERYSSAAPLSPDARQRIVSERLDMINNAVISVSIGPPSSRFLPSKDKKTWAAKDVADCVLSDKSSLKVTTSQRMAESSVLDAHITEVDGEPYWYYEYIVRKSPTKSVSSNATYAFDNKHSYIFKDKGTFVLHYNTSSSVVLTANQFPLRLCNNIRLHLFLQAPEPNLFRHNVACTAERDGYLYTLNASTLSKQWEYIGPLLQKTVASFRFLPPTENYVPPYQDPWRFW